MVNNFADAVITQSLSRSPLKQLNRFIITLLMKSAPSFEILDRKLVGILAYRPNIYYLIAFLSLPL